MASACRLQEDFFYGFIVLPFNILWFSFFFHFFTSTYIVESVRYDGFVFSMSIQKKTFLHAFQDNTLGRCARIGRCNSKNEIRIDWS